MFIDKQELERRREAEHNLVARMNVPTPIDPKEIPFDASRFRDDGTAKTCRDNEERALIGAASIAIGSAKAAEIFDVSQDYAKILARGEATRSNNPEERAKQNQELRDKIYEGLTSIRENAQKKLLMALEHINEQTLEQIPDRDKAKISANIANQLSSVIDRTINKGEHLIDQRSAHVHLYAPETRPISAFTVKNVNKPLDEGNGNGT